jgi:hypothetical protein
MISCGIAELIKIYAIPIAQMEKIGDQVGYPRFDTRAGFIGTVGRFNAEGRSRCSIAVDFGPLRFRFSFVTVHSFAPSG